VFLIESEWQTASKREPAALELGGGSWFVACSTGVHHAIVLLCLVV
jgi:hypothetical protein